MTKKSLTVADFFCGAGGFSEGFRQEGFNIVYALDIWKPAIDTHHLNHPDSLTVQKDILDYSSLEELDRMIPDTDIIIGSPPCVSFSSSNKAGKADKTLGLKLIETYLAIIALKKHKNNSNLKYWLMENVPNLRFHLKDKYSFSDLGFSNKDLKFFSIEASLRETAIEVDRSESCLFNAQEYGVPQNRVRYICGEFPFPQPIAKEQHLWITMNRILNHLRSKEENISDPLYGFYINRSDLTDHNYDTTLPKRDWEDAMIKKQHARFFGTMSFPEDETKPCRTIMATRSFKSRESIILHNGKPDVYRSPTIREVASLMSFPITYQFEGPKEEDKYRLVGNAVCPLLSASIAKSIAEKEGVNFIANKSKFIKNVKKASIDLGILEHKPRVVNDRYPKAKFAEIVPGLKKSNFRVELDNGNPRESNEITWSMSLHHGTGKEKMKKATPNYDSLIYMLSDVVGKKKTGSFQSSLKSLFNKKIPSADEFQIQYCRATPKKNILGPRESLFLIANAVNEHFPKERYENIIISNVNNKGQKKIMFNRGKLPKEEIPLRIIAGALGVALLCNLIKEEAKNE